MIAPHRSVFITIALVLGCATIASAQTPGPPTNLVVVSYESGIATLQWNAPTTGGAATSYVVQIGTSAGASDVLNQEIGNTTTFQTALPATGATYFIRVRALNSSGVSAASNEVTLPTTCTPPAVGPRGVTWRASTNAAQITWERVADATDYRIEIGSVPGAANVAVVMAGSGRRTFTDVALPGPGTYFGRVRATKTCGAGPASTEVTILAAAPTPSTSMVINEFAGFVELKNISSAPINIGSWRLQTTTGVDQIVTIAASIRGGAMVPAGCTYLLAIPGSLSVAADEPLAIAVDEGVALVRPDGFIVDAAGRRNSFDIASPDTPYREGVGLTPRRDSTGIASFARAGDVDTNDNVADFIPLATANPQNLSPCTEQPPPPPPPPPAAPQAPTNLTANVSGNTVALSWTPPPPASGGPLTNYQLEAGFAPGTSNAGVFSLPPSLTLVLFNGVPNGTFYVRVRAVNAAGVSPPSNEVTLVVCGAGCTGAPGAVTQLSFTVSGRDVLLQWRGPTSGPTPTGYVIEAGTGPGLANIGQFPTGSTAEFVVVAGVPPGTYYVRVRALNGSTQGPASNEVVITVQ